VIIPIYIIKIYMGIFKKILNFLTRKEEAIVRKYTWKPQLPDHRDYTISFTATSLPALVDLRSKMPVVYDQGNLGSCTANAIAAGVEYERLKQKEKDFIPSRLFIYYNERVMEGTVNYDAGAMIRDGIKSVNQQGVCPETEWPYTISKYRTKPSTKCYTDALLSKVLSYSAVTQTLDQLKAALAAGTPFIFGFTVYDSFESNTVATTGIVPMPLPGNYVLGGHAVIAVGYDDSKKMFIVRNSWGTSWGLKGYFYMPYAYVTSPNLASDFWTIKVTQ
jgi:C1A family cysteine protease